MGTIRWQNDTLNSTTLEKGRPRGSDFSGACVYQNHIYSFKENIQLYNITLHSGSEKNLFFFPLRTKIKLNTIIPHWKARRKTYIRGWEVFIAYYPEGRGFKARRRLWLGYERSPRPRVFLPQKEQAQGGGALLLWHFRLRLDPSVFEIMYASKRPRKSGLKRRESSQAFPIFHDKISSTGWFFTKQTERMTKIWRAFCLQSLCHVAN